MADKFSSMIGAAVDGDPTRVQCEPDEEDPVCHETADEAWEKYQLRGLVNPFHAVELQRRQNAERRKERENAPTLVDRMIEADESQ